MDDKTIRQEFFVNSLAYLFNETFEGSPAGQGSTYLDQGVGVFNTLTKLTAAQASEAVGGTTVAAQTEHLKFYLDRLVEFMNGRTERVNWDDSWLIEDVSDSEWDALRDAVRASYDKTLNCFAETGVWDDDRVAMAMGMLAHTAYHLGGIRQIAKAAETRL